MTGLTDEDWARIQRAAEEIRSDNKADGGQIANHLLPEGEFTGRAGMEASIRRRTES